MIQELQKPPMGKHELSFKWQMLIGLAERLPSFNVEWSKEEKDLWWESFLVITKAGINLSRFSDELEMYERDRRDQLSTQCRHVGDYRE